MSVRLIVYVFLALKATYVASVYIPRHMNSKIPKHKPHPDTINHHPFRVAIIDQNNHFVCSGAIIGRRWVVTTAQCVYQKQNLSVRSGTSCWAFRGNLHNVTNIIVHPKYTYTEPPNATYYHDIAVLKVNRLFDEMKHASPIPITGRDITLGQRAKLSNWGRHKTKEGNYMWSNLVIIHADTISRKICRSRIPELTMGMLCYRENSVNYFPPDRGSAYVVHGTLGGMMSFGREPYNSRAFNVLTSVLYYRKWIANVLRRCSNAVKRLPGTNLHVSSFGKSTEELAEIFTVPPRDDEQPHFQFQKHLWIFGLRVGDNISTTTQKTKRPRVVHQPLDDDLFPED